MVTYKKAGVNVDKANSLVDWIKKLNPSIGGFSGLYPVGKNLFLSASCDGVGTKLKIAHIANKHDTVGIDLVAMNVNDVLCCGAKPLFFLDYFACGKLDTGIAKQVISGIKEGCDQAGCILLGGETAEMPGFYEGKDYDLAGFTVGSVEKRDIIDGSKIKDGDLILGIPSSGLHSNGYSLVRKVLSEKEIKKHIKTLLKPTKIYVKELLPVLKVTGNAINGICHITGGGFYDNIVRILPKNIKAVIYKNNWNVPEIFRVVQKKGKISDSEIYRTLNMGIGMVLFVRCSGAVKIQKMLKNSIVIGQVESGRKEVVVV